MICKKTFILFCVALFGLLFFQNPAFAQSVTGSASSCSATVNLNSMFCNFKESAEAITKLIKYSSWIIGLYLVISSVFKFSQLGSNPQMSPKIPIVTFFVGIGVFSLTGAVSIAMETMAMSGANGAGAFLAPKAGVGDFTAGGILGVLTFIRMVGYLAFVRGFLLLNQAGLGKEGVLGRGLTHIFGGAAAINVQGTADILANTLAPGLPMPW